MASFEESSTQPMHLEGCNVAHRDKDPGKADPTFRGLVYNSSSTGRPTEFPEEYLNCFGCCVAYLTTKRGYSIIEVSNSEAPDFVHFDIENVKSDIPKEWCTVKCSGPAKSGQIFVDNINDKDKGKPACRAIENHRTYQIYTEDGIMSKVIGSGCYTYVRLESVFVDMATRADLSNLKMRYVDAVLLERYKTLHGSSDRARKSFEGCCVIVEDTGLQKLEDKLEDKIEDKLEDQFREIKVEDDVGLGQ